MLKYERTIAQLVARMHGVHEVGSSSLPSPTTSNARFCMSLSSASSRVLSACDYICFRIFPGGCFLFIVGKILFAVDESLRSPKSPWLLPFIAFEIFILASLLVWVLVGDEVYKQRVKGLEETEKNHSFLKHLVAFVVNFTLVFFFTPKGITLLGSLAFSGAVYTLGSFLLEFLLVLPSLFNVKGKDKKSLRANILLGCFAIVGYVLPLVWVSIQVSQRFSYPGVFLVNILFVMLGRWR